MTDPKFPELSLPVTPDELSLRGRIALYLLHGCLSGPLAGTFGGPPDVVADAVLRMADSLIAADREPEEDERDATP